MNLALNLSESRVGVPVSLVALPCPELGRLAGVECCDARVGASVFQSPEHRGDVFRVQCAPFPLLGCKEVIVNL